MKTIALLGSTGSIGRQTLQVVEQFPERFRVLALSTRTHIELLAQQIEIHHPQVVAVAGEREAKVLEALLSRSAKRALSILQGPGALVAIAREVPFELLVSAVVGSAGLEPTMAAIERGLPIALANKETLVSAGELVMKSARRFGSTILPIDSEHSAIFQCLQGEERQSLRKLYITASGGPFRTWSKERIESATPEQALAHPNWQMGAKITVDSATMMNKGLEVIEARYLFDIDPQNIEVLVHPQSIIHSMAGFADGSIKAQLGEPDMKVPIAYALSYPQRLSDLSPVPDFAQIGSLTFEKPDAERFPCLGLALEALRVGGTLQSVMNAANEVAVQAFLEGKIGFYGISAIIEEVMHRHTPSPIQEIANAIEADQQARREARRLIAQA